MRRRSLSRVGVGVGLGLVLLAIVPLASAVEPLVSIDSGPGSPTSSTSAQFFFSSPLPSAIFGCKIDLGSFAPCTSGVTFSVGDGSHTFDVEATDTASELPNTSVASFAWTVDLSPPSLTLPNQSFDVPDYTGPVAVTYAGLGASDASGIATFSCTPASGSSFSLGTTPVTCNASDNVGNTASGSLTVTLTDTTPPPTPSITSGPAGTITDTTPTFTFSSAGAASFVCAFDDLTPSATCISPRTAAALADGSHFFAVASRDANNNVSSVTTAAFSVDTAPPGTNITSSVLALTTSHTISIGFAATESGATFACSLDGAAFGSCASPASLTDLGDGSHTFRVRSQDAAGNTDATPDAVTWVVDATPPTLSPIEPLNKAVEADGPGGTRLAFAVSAADDGVALLPSAITCLPAAGSLFPLGNSIVTCQASDAAGNIGVLTFTISVTDTTPPSINAPDVSFTATDASGIAQTEAAVSAYLSGISASDLVSTPNLSTKAPAVFPIGATTLVVTARDAAGNTAAKNVTVTVLQPGVRAPPPDLTPPGRVTSLKARAGDQSVALTWGQPLRDVARFEVRQAIVGEPGTDRLIYSGLEQAFTSKRLRNGATYRFVLVAFDAAGNGSASVVVNASPRAQLLASPRPGARVSAPPPLRWAPVPSTYFNVQIYRGGVKVLSVWPTRAQLHLSERWIYRNRKYQFGPGVYTWYVWPGIGARADVRYGELLGKSSFVAVAAQNT